MAKKPSRYVDPQAALDNNNLPIESFGSVDNKYLPNFKANSDSYSEAHPEPIGDTGTASYVGDQYQHNSLDNQNVYQEDIPNIEDERASNQSTIGALGDATAKFLGKTVLSTVGNLAGTVYGVADAVAKGDVTKIWDNSFMDAVDAGNKKLDNIFQVYKNSDYSQQNILQKLFLHPTQFTDEATDTASFMAGAILSEIATSGVGSETIIPKALRYMKFLSEGAEASEATSVLASLATKGITLAGDLGTSIKHLAMGASYEGIVEARQATLELRQKMEEDYSKDHPGEDIPDNIKNDIDDRLSKAGVFTYLSNLALVGGTNLLLFPKLFGLGHETAKLAEGSIVKDAESGLYEVANGDKHSLLDNIKTGLTKPIEESTKFGVQGAVSQTAREFWDRKHDAEAKGDTDNLLTTFAKQLADTYTSKEGWNNIGMGMIIGALGAPGRGILAPLGVDNPLGKYGYKDIIDANGSVIGKEKLPSWTGGVAGSFHERAEQEAKIGKVLADLNEHTNFFKAAQANYNTMVENSSIQKDQDKALQDGDIFNFQNAKDDQIHSYVSSRVKNNLYDDLLDEVDNMKKLSPDQFYTNFKGDVAADKASDIEKLKFQQETTSQFLAKAKNTRDAIKIADDVYKGDNDDLRDHLVHSIAASKNLDIREKLINQSLADLSDGMISNLSLRSSNASVPEIMQHLKDVNPTAYTLNKGKIEQLLTDSTKLRDKRQDYLDVYNHLFTQEGQKQFQETQDKIQATKQQEIETKKKEIIEKVNEDTKKENISNTLKKANELTSSEKDALDSSVGNQPSELTKTKPKQTANVSMNLDDEEEVPKSSTEGTKEALGDTNNTSETTNTPIENKEIVGPNTGLETIPKDDHLDPEETAVVNIEHSKELTTQREIVTTDTGLALNDKIEKYQEHTRNLVLVNLDTQRTVGNVFAYLGIDKIVSGRLNREQGAVTIQTLDIFDVDGNIEVNKFVDPKLFSQNHYTVNTPVEMFVPTFEEMEERGLQEYSNSDYQTAIDNLEEFPIAFRNSDGKIISYVPTQSQIRNRVAEEFREQALKDNLDLRNSINENRDSTYKTSITSKSPGFIIANKYEVQKSLFDALGDGTKVADKVKLVIAKAPKGNVVGSKDLYEDESNRSFKDGSIVNSQSLSNGVVYSLLPSSAKEVYVAYPMKVNTIGVNNARTIVEAIKIFAKDNNTLTKEEKDSIGNIGDYNINNFKDLTDFVNKIMYASSSKDAGDRTVFKLFKNNLYLSSLEDKKFSLQDIATSQDIRNQIVNELSERYFSVGLQGLNSKESYISYHLNPDTNIIEEKQNNSYQDYLNDQKVLTSNVKGVHIDGNEYAFTAQPVIGFSNSIQKEIKQVTSKDEDIEDAQVIEPNEEKEVTKPEDKPTRKTSKKLNIDSNKLRNKPLEDINPEFVNKVNKNEIDKSPKILKTLALPKIEQLFNNQFLKGNKDKFYNEVTSLGAGKEQTQILKNWVEQNNPKTIEDLKIGIAAELSYTTEINITKGLANPDSIAEYEFETLEGQLESDLITQEEYNRRYNQLLENSTKQNSSYYSNLTVPGGTNYIENEISTPQIEPSIKGHAQFSTRNSIGWFRSDEKRIDDNTGKRISDGSGGLVQLGQITDSKVRRILEVQSDLFQKGRDRENLTTNRHDADFNSETQQWEKGKINLDKNKQNQFLQLLNKDNNWTSFFVKSIIQDSARKGYEEVHFPTGDTASKVEGHTTLEEHKANIQSGLDRAKSFKPEDKYNLRLKTAKDNLESNQKALDKYGNQTIQNTTDEFIKPTIVNSNYNYVRVRENLYEKKYGKNSSLTGDDYDGFVLHQYTVGKGNNIRKISNAEAQELLDKNNEIRYNEKEKDVQESLKEVQDLINRKDWYTSKIIEDNDRTVADWQRQLDDIETEGFAKLKPIYNFYENVVQNILKKNYSVERVKDEHGNEWNKVSLDDSHKGQIHYDINPNKSVLDQLFVDIDKFSDSQQREVVDSIIYAIEEGKKDGYSTVDDLFDYAKDMFANSKEGFSDMNDDSSLDGAIQKFQDIEDHWDRFKEKVLDKLKGIGIKITKVFEDNLPVDTKDTTDTPDLQEQEVDSPTESFTGSEANYQRDNYSDQFSQSISSKDTASAHLKLKLSLIPEVELVGNRLEPATNFLGMSKFMDLNKVWTSLQGVLTGLPESQIFPTIAKLAKSNPMYSTILSNIMDDPSTNIQNEFVVAFSKQQMKPLTPKIGYADKSDRRTINVFGTNRQGATDILIDKWYDSFKTSQIVMNDEEGNLVINTKVANQASEAFTRFMSNYNDKDLTLSSRLQQGLKSIGIELSLATTDNLIKNGTKIGKEKLSAKEFLDKYVSLVFKRLEGAYTPQENLIGDMPDIEDSKLSLNNPFISETKALNALATLENNTNPFLYEASYVGGDGKPRYSITNNSYISKFFNSLEDEESGLAKINNILSTTYASTSIWGNKFISNTKFRDNFSYHPFDSLGTQESKVTNKVFSKMSSKEKEFTRMSLFQNVGRSTSIFMAPIPSDKTTLPLIQAQKTKVVIDIQNLRIRNSEAINAMYTPFLAEYNRIREVQSQQVDPKFKDQLIDGYHNGMGEKFLIYDMLNGNKELFDSKGQLKLVDPDTLRKIVTPEIEKFATDLIKKQIKYWSKLELDTPKVFDKSYKKTLGDFGEDDIRRDINITKVDREKQLKSANSAALRTFAADYAINQFLAHFNYTQLISGDPALHGKDTIEKTWINYSKRLAKDIAPGLDGNFINPNFSTIFLKDLSYSSKHLNEYMEALGEKASAYKNINPADAQEYTTLKEHLTVMEAYGKLTPLLKAAGDRLLAGGEDPFDIDLILQPMKPVYVGTKIDNAMGINRMYYIKTSSFPLIPSITKGLEIDKLRVAMENGGIDRAVYESGVKLGLGTTKENIQNTDGTFNNLDLKDKGIILDRDGFRIQQEVPFHGNHENTINEGSQARKLILSDLDDDAKVETLGTTLSGKIAKQVYEALHVEKMNRDFNNLLKDIGIDKNNTIKDLSKLQKILLNEATSRNYNINDIYGLQITTDSNGNQRFTIPLGFNNSSNRLESILNSLFTNRVIKSELPGFSKVQGASSGFSKLRTIDQLNSQVKDSIIWVDPKDTDLNYIRKDESGKKLLQADILVPSWFTDKSGKDIDISTFVKEDGTLDTDRLPKDLLTAIGLRIPTQGLNSMMSFKVKGFLPKIVGDLAIVPPEIVAQMGSDFDADKLYMYRYHHNYNEATKSFTKIEAPEIGENQDYSKYSDEELDNSIVQMFQDRYEDPSLLGKILEPNGFGELPSLAKEISDILKLDNTGNFFTTETQNQIHKNNNDGKAGCLAYGTKVLMFNGVLKEVQDVVVGDQLMGIDSTPRNILDLKRGIEQMYWIRQKRGLDYRVNKSHILSLIDKSIWTNPKIINIKLSEYLSKTNTYKSKQSFGYKSEGLEFKSENIILDPYYLGLWLGDGATRDISIIHNIDKEIRDYLDSTYKIGRVEGFNNITMKLDSKKLRDDFKKVYNTKKSGLDKKFIVDNYLYSSKKDRLSLLAGLIDSDGTYCKDSKQYKISNTNYKLIEQISFLTRSLGFYTSIKKVKGITKSYPNGKIYTNKDFWNITFTPEYDIPVKIYRKKQVSKSNFKDRLLTGIEIEKDIVDNYYGFILDGDHLFHLEDLTITHNTGIFSLFSTFIKVAQDAKLRLETPVVFKVGEDIIRESSLYSKGIKQTPSTTISYLQSASVDNAKEQILGSLNINSQTMDVAGIIALTGFDESYIAYFLSQPIIRDYVDALSNMDDITNPEYNVNKEIEAQKKIESKYNLTDDEIKTIKDNVSGVSDNPLVYSSDSMRDELSNPTNLNQRMILDQYIKVKETAKAIRLIQNAISTDTSGLGIRYVDLQVKSNNIILAQANELIINADQIFNGNTQIGKAADILNNALKIYKKILPYSTPVYENATTRVLELMGKADKSSLYAEDLNGIYNSIKSYLYSTNSLLDIKDVNAERQRLLYGTQALGNRWEAYTQTPAGKKNLLSERIQVKRTTSLQDPIRLSALNTPAANSSDNNDAMAAYYRMYHKGTDVEKELAKDLVNYFVLTGAKQGPNSIAKYIPYDILEEHNFSNKLNGIDQSLRDSNGTNILEHSVEQYFQHNPNKAIAFDVKNKDIHDFKKEGFTMSPSSQYLIPNTSGDLTPPTYMSIYDRDIKNFALYKIAESTILGSKYSRIDLLGDQYISEYNANEVAQYSIVKSNSSNITIPSDINKVTTEDTKSEDTQLEEPKEQVTAIDKDYLTKQFNLDNNSPETTLNSIIDGPNKEYSDIAKDLKGLLVNYPDLKISTEGTREGIAGRFTDNTVSINLDNILTNSKDPVEKTQRVILHEMLHAITANKINNYENLSPTDKKLVDKIRILFNQYRTITRTSQSIKFDKLVEQYKKNPSSVTSEDRDFIRDHKEEFYAVNNIHDFVAAGLTDDAFVQQLKDKNLWQKLWTFVSGLLGLNESYKNDYEALYNTALELGKSKDNYSGTDIDDDTNASTDINPSPKDQKAEFLSKYHLYDGKPMTSPMFDRVKSAMEKNSKYDNIKIDLAWENGQRVLRVFTKKGTPLYDINPEPVVPKTKEEKIVDKQIKHLYDIRNRYMSNPLYNENIRLQAKVESIEKEIKDIQEENSVDIITSSAKDKIASIATIMGREGLMNQYDIDDSKLHLSWYKNIRSFINYNEAFEEENKSLDEISRKADALLKELLPKQVESLSNFITQEFGLDLDIQKIFNEPNKEVGKGESTFQNALQSTSPKIETMGRMIRRSKISMEAEIDDYAKEFRPIFNEFLSKHKNWEMFKQVNSKGEWTGNLINKYSQSYYDNLKERAGKAKDYSKFKRENTDYKITDEDHDRFLEAIEAIKVAHPDWDKKGSHDEAIFKQWSSSFNPSIYISKLKKGIRVSSEERAKYENYVTITPTDRWLDPKYQTIKKLGADSVEAKAYNELDRLFRMLAKKVGNQANYIPEYGKEWQDFMLKGEAKGIFGKISKDLVDALTIKLESKINDNLTDVDGVPIDNIPIFGQSNVLNPKDKSDDLGRVAITAMIQDTMARHKAFIEPYLNSAKDLIRSKESYLQNQSGDVLLDSDGNPRTTTEVGRTPNLMEQAMFIPNSFLYNKSKEHSEPSKSLQTTRETLNSQGQIAKETRAITGSKVVDFIGSFTRMKALGYNPISSGGRILFGVLSTFINSGERLSYGEAEAFKAFGEAIQAAIPGTAKNKKVKALSEFFQMRDLLNEKRFSGLGVKSTHGVLGDVNPYTLVTKAEDFIQHHTGVAVLMTEKVMDLSGKQQSLYDAFDNDGNWKISEFGANPYIDSQSKYNMITKVQDAIKDAHGDYSDETQMNRSYVTRALLIMRQWIPQTLAYRFGKEYTDAQGNLKKGRYRSFSINPLTNIGNIWKAFTVDADHDNIDLRNMRMNTYELSLIPVLWGVALMLKGMLHGLYHDNEKEKAGLTMILNSLTRVSGNLAFYFNPYSFESTIREPIPAFKTVMDFYDIGPAVMQQMEGKGTYKTGYHKGQNKLSVKLRKALPIINRVDQADAAIHNLEDKN